MHVMLRSSSDLNGTERGAPTREAASALVENAIAKGESSSKRERQAVVGSALVILPTLFNQQV